jgi:hypothetical protein
MRCLIVVDALEYPRPSPTDIKNLVQNWASSKLQHVEDSRKFITRIYSVNAI